VPWLHLAMTDAGLVRGVERLARLAHHAAHEPERQAYAERRAPTPIELGEVDAIDVLLHEIRGALVHARVDGADDARVDDARHETRFVDHAVDLDVARGGALRQRGAQRLDDNRDAENRVLREIALAHAAFAEASPHCVVTDSCGQRHAREYTRRDSLRP